MTETNDSLLFQILRSSDIGAAPMSPSLQELADCLGCSQEHPDVATSIRTDDAFMRVLELIVPAVIAITVLLWLWFSTRAVVDGAVVTVSQYRREAAIVQYRCGPQVIRFTAQVGPAPAMCKAYLRIEVPENIYTRNGDSVSAAEIGTILSRVSRGLAQLAVASEFYSAKVHKAV